MDKKAIARQVASEAETGARKAQEALRAAKLDLIQVCKEEALKDLQEYPQHAETILSQLLVAVDGILR